MIQIGNCPKCGTPIYSQSPWHSILPPPAIYTCNCHASNITITTTTTTQSAGMYIQEPTCMIEEFFNEEAKKSPEQRASSCLIACSCPKCNKSFM